MKDRITIIGRDGRFDAYIRGPAEGLSGSRRRRSARGVQRERRYSQRPVTNRPNQASWRSRPTCSGVRSRTSTGWGAR